MSDRFTGKGFSREPISEDEAASLRELLKEMQEGDALEAAMDVAAIVGGIRVFHNMLKIGGPVLLAAAALGVLGTQWGLF